MTAGQNGVGVTGVALVALALTGCTVNVNTEGATASETHTFKVGAAPKITLDTFDGSIEVHSWDRAEVEVIVEKQAQDDTLLQQIVVEQSQDGDAVTLRVRGPAASGHDGIQIGVVYSPGAKLRVALPKSVTLDIRSGDGSITVEDVSGTVTMRSGDGSIVGLRVSGDVRATTDDGSIRLRETTGKVDVETLDGSVIVNGTFTALRAKSGDGSVRIAADKGSAVESDWLVDTEDGSVEVRLPEGLSAVVDAATSDGSIRSSYPGLTVPETPDGEGERRDDGRQLKATLGQGGHTLRVRTGDGTIRFES
jgi:Putative adhesin